MEVYWDLISSSMKNAAGTYPKLHPNVSFVCESTELNYHSANIHSQFIRCNIDLSPKIPDVSSENSRKYPT